MRKLTNQEEKALSKAYNEAYDNGNLFDGLNRFQLGFSAGLDYAQAKLNAYAAYVAGKITLKELEDVVNAD